MQLSEYVVAQAAVLIVPTLEDFQKKLMAELKAVQTELNRKNLQVGVEAKGTSNMVAEIELAKKLAERDPIKIKVDTVDVMKRITEIRHNYEDLGRDMRKALVLDLKITGAGLLPQLAQGLAAANASMVQLVQTSLLLPGILAGIGSSILTVVTGLGGVKDAFKEYGDAQKNAAQEGLKARNNALNVQNAYRDLGRSIKDAKRNLEDLNAQLRDAPLNEADAIIRVQEAIAEANDKAGKSGLQQQKDALAVMKAENDLADTRLRNSRLIQDVAEANAKGVQGADSVREATDRLAKAQDQANTTTTKLSDSLKKISPNAQAFVQAITGMQSQWMDFQNSVQDRLFAGLDGEVTRLGQVSIPMLQKGLGGIADALNGNVKAAFKSLETDTNQGFLGKIFSDTADAQTRLNDAFDPFLDGFLRLTSAGTSFLPRLVEGLNDLAVRFDNFIVRAEGDGSLDKWINQGIDEFKALGNSIINVSSILTSLSEAFTNSGGETFLQYLESASKRLAEFLKSAEGQDKLKDFFTQTRAELANWKPLLDELPGLLQNVAEAGQAWANMLMPFLTTAARFLGEHPTLVKNAFAAYMLWRNVLPVVKGIRNSVESFNGAMRDMGQKVFGDAQGHIGRFATATDTAKTKIGNLANSVMSGGGLFTVASTLATVIGVRLVQAHDDAAAAARRQQQDAEALAGTLSDVTGAATAATNAMIAKNFRTGMNEATGKVTGNDLAIAVPDVNKQNEIVTKIAQGDLAGAISMIPAASASDIANSPVWKDNEKLFTEAGFKPQDLADAVNGEPNARKRFDDWFAKKIKIPGFSDYWSKLAYDASGGGLPDLLQLQDSLPANVAAGSRARGEAYSAGVNIQQGQADIQGTNAVAQGRVRLPDGSPLASFGVIAGPGLGTNGGELTTSSAPPEGSPLADQLRNDGVTFALDGPGRYRVTLSKEAANKYFERYASGGLISGPGTGTSDSILARLSHGEYVVNAKATQQHLPMLEKINGGGLPGYDSGGFIGPGGEPPSPSIGPPWYRQGVADARNTAKWRADWWFNSGTGFNSKNDGPLSHLIPGFAIGGLMDMNPFIKPPGYTAPPPMVPRGYQQPGPTWPTAKPEPYVDSRGMLRNAGTVLPEYGGIKLNDASASVMYNYGLGSGINAGFAIGYDGKRTVSSVPFPNAPTPSNPSTPVAPPVSGSTSTPPVPPTPSTPPATTTPSTPPLLPAEAGFPGAAVVTSNPGPSESGYSAPVVTIQPQAASGVPAIPITPEVVAGVTPEVNFGAERAATYGLHVTSGYRNEPGSFHSTGQAGDYSNQVQFGPPTPEMTAWANEALSKYAPYIDELIYSGVSQNVYRGQLVPAIDMPGSPYNTGQAGYHGDHVHIAWKPGALQQLAAAGIAVPGSPSNMPMAMTPTGVGLPQITYGTSGGSQVADAAQQGGLRLPTPEEYAKYVSDSWQKTLQGAVQNAGSIAINALGSFFGIDLSKITGLANSVVGGIDLPGTNDGNSGSSSGDSLPANDRVGSIISGAGGIPPGYQQAYSAAQSSLSAGYDPTKGAEQWRPTVRSILQKVAPKYGIKNLKAWEDALVKQIQTESNGNPNIDNLNDSNGKGGTQAVYGLGQFLPETFAKHNVANGDIRDPIAQIYAMIDYVASKYGMDSSGAPKQIGRGVGYATGGMVPKSPFKPIDPNDWINQHMGDAFGGGSLYGDYQTWVGNSGAIHTSDPMENARGGKISGRGTGSSDSILARVSNGEFIVRAPMAQKHMGLLDAINKNKLPGYADGGFVNPLFPPPVPAPVPPPPPPTPPPPPPAAPPVGAPDAPPSPAPPDPMGPQAAADAAMQPAPVDPAAQAMQDVGATIGGIGDAISGIADGAQAPSGGDPAGDPRAVLGAAPVNMDHNKPGVSEGIQAAGAAISGAISTAMQAAGGAMGGPGGAAAAGSASGVVSGLMSAAAGAVSGAVNVLSSLGVGTVTPSNSTAGAYGAPLLPEANGQQPYTGPQMVNNFNGGVHTSNNEEFYKLQQRRELQNASAYLPQR